MAVETKFICDRCNAAQPTHEQMWEIDITYTHYGFGYTPYHVHAQLWCRKCMESQSFFAPIQLKEEAKTPAPTLEDIIRELIRQELPSAQSL